MRNLHNHAKWRALLGLDVNPAVPKEHWTRVKALSRRLAEGWTDEYDTLRPVADLRFELQLQVYLMLQRPLRWKASEPDEDERQAIIDEAADVYDRRAPIPTVTASPDQNRFLKDIAACIDEVAAESELIILE